MKSDTSITKFSPKNRGCVTTYDIVKLASLLFDKIYLPPTLQNDSDLSAIPKGLTFYDASLKNEIHDRSQTVAREATKLIDNPFDADEANKNAIQNIRISYTRIVSQVYSSHGYDVVPFYNSQLAFQSAFPEGQELAYQAILDNLSIISENDVTWKQVLQFKKDKQALRKYRALRLWLTEGLEAKTVQAATDIIGKKIDDYEWAIKKHGWKTVTGSLISVFDPKMLGTISAISTTAGLLGGVVWSAITAGGLLVAGITIKLVDSRIDLADTKRNVNSEIALIRDIRQKFGK